MVYDVDIPTIYQEQLKMSNDAQATEEGGIDDFLDGIGLDIKPSGPEDALMIKLTGAGFNELHLLRYWLMHQLHEYYSCIKDGILFMRKNNITRELTIVKIDEYAKIYIKYYLRMKYLPYFHQDVAGVGIANIDTMADMVLNHSAIRPMIDGKHEDLPKLACL